MKFKFQLILVALAFAGFKTFCQQEDQFSRYVFKMSPQHLTQNILKAGVEIFNSEHNKSFSILAQAVANNKSKDYYEYNIPYNGFGTELSFKKYLSPFRPAENRKGRMVIQGIYFSSFLQGGIYKGNYDYTEYTWDPQTSTSTPIEVKFSKSAKNIAAGFTIGLQRSLWKVLTFDVYLGAGVQGSQTKIAGVLPGYYYGSGLFQPDYYGILPKAGLLIGVGL